MDANPPSLKVLIVDDSEADVQLILRALRELPESIQHVQVAGEVALVRALEEFAPDVILSDFSMPGFSGPEALRIVTEVAPDVPFLFVSGTIGEERAIEALQKGAADYVLKDNLRRLPSAMTRALEIAHDRSHRRLMERALRESEERFRTIVESSQDWIWENQCDTTLVYTNDAIGRILGYGPEDMLGKVAAERMLPDDRNMVEQRMPELASAGRGWHKWRLRWRHRDGSVRVLESTATPRRDAEGAVVGYRGVDQDITERLEQEARIRQLVRIHEVLSAVGNAVLEAKDRDALLFDACRVAVEGGGFKAAGIGVRGPGATLQVVARYGDPRVLGVVAPNSPLSLMQEDPNRHPGLLAFRENRRVAVQDFTHPGLPDDLREEMAGIGIQSEIALPIGAEPWGLLALFSETKQVYDQAEVALLERLAREIDHAVDFLAKGERLEYIAYHNQVTHLHNRVAFQQRLKAMFDGSKIAVAVLQVQRMGMVNDSRGRAFGDRLLRAVAERLLALAGKEQQMVAHLDSTTFASAGPSMDDQSEVSRLEALIQAIEGEPFELDGEQVHVELCGGLALAPEHGTDPEGLEQAALAALDECKKRNVRIHVFDCELRGRAARRMEMEGKLHRAIDSEQFELFYQPKFDATTNRLAGAEALLRWRHPERGLVSPADFIPLLEDTGMIVPVGRWVMRTALGAAQAWRALDQGLRIAVNVSARELRQNDFLAVARTLLEPFAKDQPLDIEITESLLMDDIENSTRALFGLREMGCKVAIDDFGTGYSSLNYLARLPADTLKIDRSFIGALTESPQTMSLVTNIINLAHSLGLTVVAEGVETSEQARLLRLLRCDVLQGYFLGRPMPADQFAELLRAPIPP